MSRLLNIQTDLKSLKFGNDRPRGGNSGQPYIKDEIGESSSPSSPDFLLRGGLNAPSSAAEDVVRLAKYFVDPKSPQGSLFITKQELLSASSVRTQSTIGSFNQGVYNPASTLAQAGGGFLGLHLRRNGINVISKTGPNSTNEELYGVKVKSSQLPKDNRLINLAEALSSEKTIQLNGFNLNPNKDGLKLMSYRGGPGSVLGQLTNTIISTTNNRIGIGNLTPNTLEGTDQGKMFDQGTKAFSYQQISSIGTPGSLEGYKDFKFSNQKERATTQQRDFREPLLKDTTISYVTGIAPSYNPANSKTIDGIETSRIGYSSPGQRGNIRDYTKGKILNGGTVSIVDKINFQPIYESKTGVRNTNVEKNDLVKFRIAAIDSENPSVQQYIHFRAYIDSFSDAYTAQWDAINYMGRGESFHKYKQFGRTINMGFTVAAQSKPELIAQYKKLNFLASNLAPTYSSQGYMGGPLVRLTLGGWCYEQPGFITAMTLNVPQNSPWEIGIDTNGEFDNSVKELPHIVQVTGFSFTPIEEFRPQKQTLTFNDKGDLSKDEGKPEYGPQRFIALSNGENNNYDN